MCGLFSWFKRSRAQVGPENNIITYYGDNFMPKTRTCSDVIFLLILFIFMITHIYFIYYCEQNGDIERLLRGYDFCGNICGIKNEPDDKIPCKGADHTENKFFLIEPPYARSNNLNNRQCVKTCDIEVGYIAFFNRCLKNDKFSLHLSIRALFTKSGLHDFFDDVSEDIYTSRIEIIALFFIAFVLSLLTVFFLRFVVASFIWVLLISSIIFSFIASIFFWLQYYGVFDDNNIDTDNSDKKTWLAYAIISTIFAVVITFIIIVLRKRIEMVIALISEAGKALCDMPTLLFEPLLTFASFTILCIIWIYCQICIESAGFLTMESDNSAEYVKDATIIIARWYNIFLCIWLAYFFIGCQHIIIAGSVAIWFFTRNKNTLKSPLTNSINLLLRYHLGTVAVGSFVISIVKALRYLIKKCSDLSNKVVSENNKIKKIIFYPLRCCLYCFDKFIQFISRNAYIMTAIYGYPFCKASKESFEILVNNAFRVATINSVGDFILILAKLFVIILTGFASVLVIESREDLHYKWSPTVIVVIFAYYIANMFISVYEMTVDTLFICFCIDCDINDGITKPYFMSRGLMEFVLNTKKKMGVDDTNNNGRVAWSNNNNNSNYIDNNNNDKLTTISENVN